MEEINDQSTSVLTASFFDEAGNPVTPTSGDYRIDDLASGSVIKGTTAISPTGVTHDITISSAENKIVNEALLSEIRLVTVTWNYSGKKATGEYRYRIKNLIKLQ